MTARPASGLLSALQQIPDPRGRQGLRHSLPAMLAAAVCAVMSGYASYAAIAQWIHSQDASFWHALGFQRRPPQEDAFRKFFNRLDPRLVGEVLAQWVDQVEGLRPAAKAEPEIAADDLRPETVDGKTLRGTRDKWERARQVVSVLSNGTGRIRVELAVSPETNENKTAVELLKTLVLKGKLIVADAGFCQRDFCQTVRDREGEYLVLVKDNQPKLHKEVRQAFVIPRAFSPLQSEAGPCGAASGHYY